MEEYSKEQIIALYEKYSRLDESKLIRTLKKEIREIYRKPDSSSGARINTRQVENEIGTRQTEHSAYTSCADSDIKKHYKYELLRETLKIYRLISVSNFEDSHIESLVFNEIISELSTVYNLLLYLLGDGRAFTKHHDDDKFDSHAVEYPSFIEDLQEQFSQFVKQNPNSSNSVLDFIIFIAPYFAQDYVKGSISVAVGLIMIALKNYVLFPKLKEHKNSKSPKRPRRPRFNFHEMGLKNGEVLNWKYDQSIITKVKSDRTVIFNGKELSLTKVTCDLKQTNVRKPCRYWLYNKKLLSDIYNETYPVI